jgi:hypothetical protein
LRAGLQKNSNKCLLGLQGFSKKRFSRVFRVLKGKRYKVFKGLQGF